MFSRELLLRDEGWTSLKVILVVTGDKELGTKLIQLILQETAYFAILAEDRFRALATMEEIIPDLLVLDFFLHGTNGDAFYRHLQSMKTLRGVPALIINSPIIQSFMEKMRRVIYLGRPFEQDKLLFSLKELVSSP